MTERIIDSDAINKRVLRDIKDVEYLSKRIRGENLKENLQFGTPEKYGALAADNFNINGIEFSKIKQLVNYIQTHKKEFLFDEILDRVDNEPKDTAISQYSTSFDANGEVVDNTGPNDSNFDNGTFILNGTLDFGKEIPNSKTEIIVPNGFDGRNAFVYPRIVLLYENGSVDWSANDDMPLCWEEDISQNDNEELAKRIVEQNESFHFGLTMQGDVNNINCWSAPIEGTPASWLMVSKSKNKIIINTKANLAVYNCGYDATKDSDTIHTCKYVDQNNHVIAAYVYALIMYWRDK